MRLRSALYLGISALVFGETAALAQGKPPAAPSNLQAIVLSADAIVLAWDDNSPNETGFRIEGRVQASSYEELGVVPADRREALLDTLEAGTTYFFRIRATNTDGNSGYSNEVSATTLTESSTCAENSRALCLAGGRFRVRALFQAGGGPVEDASVVKLTGDSGYLWFFNPANVEVIVKVVNACAPPFERFWFFAAGLTNVLVDIEVTDTATGDIKHYVNPPNQPFAPIQDTEGFDTCSAALSAPG